MPSYKLKYFNARGLGEISRFLLALSGTAYQDVRISNEAWLKEKSNAPLGQLPVLEVTDKGQVVTICQSSAIDRYLARTFSFHGRTDLEAAHIDEVLGVATDAVQLMIWARYEQDQALQKQLMKALLDKELPKYTKMLDTLLQRTPGKFILGDKMSLADVSVLDLVEKMELMGFKGYEKTVQDCSDAVASNSKIKAWLESRPHSEY